MAERHRSRSRELRDHIFSHKCEVQRGEGRKKGKAREREYMERRKAHTLRAMPPMTQSP